MKRIVWIALVFAVVGNILIGCTEDKSKGELVSGKYETSKQEMKKTAYKVDGSTLRVTGGDTLSMDEVWRIWEDKRIRFLSLSPDVKNVLPLSEEREKKKEDHFFSLERAFLEGNSLTLKGLSCLLNELRICKIVYPDIRSGEEKIYEVECNGIHDSLYKSYLRGSKQQDGMYIVDGILYSYDGNKKDIVIPDTVTEIAEHAFNSCELKSIKLGSHVRKIGSDAFGACKLEEDLVIPNSVEIIAEGAFGCVKRVVFEGDTKKYDRELCREKQDTIYSFEKGVPNSFTNIIDTSYEEHDAEKGKVKVRVSWVPVEQADGYEICTNTGWDYDERLTDDYATIRNVASDKDEMVLAVPVPPEGSDVVWDSVGIRIRPYKNKGKQKVYGESAKTMYEGEEVEWSRDI